MNIANAQTFTDQLGDVQSQVGFAQTDAAFFVGQIIWVALSITGVLLLIFVVYAGFLWMTAGGDGDQVKKAQSYMRNAVIGLVIILCAYSITRFVVGALG
jgi:Na+-driven multidrug efflux pump